MLKVCLAGATGWAGSELARGIAAVDDVALVSAVSRKHAGRKLQDVLGDERLDTPVFATATEALARPCDVLVEYTTAASAKANVLAALEHGAHVVVGASGLTDADYAEIDALVRASARGVLA
jgi:4-hydroxy-tetrahydrodipicolinate reductase